MAKVDIGDDVLHNILGRLPGKPLLQLRCASKHWNRLISDPYFMKTRSRRMILLPFPRPLVVIDDNVPVEDSMVRVRSPLEHHQEGTQVSIVGTLNNGIVLLALYDTRCHLILYNPLTCASKVLVVIDPDPLFPKKSYVFGFASCGDDQLKIVMFELLIHPLRHKFDVFDLKTSSWSTPSQYLEAVSQFMGNAGMFLNGFLYWSTSTGILALNVKDMVFSKVKLPEGLNYAGLLLGSLDGCLCMVKKTDFFGFKFDVWLWKEDNCSWMKAHSFTFGVNLEGGNAFQPICILGNGKIILTNTSMQLVMYDTSKHSYKTLNGLATLDDLKTICRVFNFKRIDEIFRFKDILSIEYVESLVSPFDM